MTVKVQCGCGSKYAFEIEPQNGVMPVRVTCPSCGADGTDAANQFIAETAASEPSGKPRLRMANAPAAPAAPEAEEPRPLPPPRPVAGASIERIQAEARKMRRVGWAIAFVLLLVAGLIGAWGWYLFVGSKPQQAFVLKLDPSQTAWRTEFLDGGKLLMASPTRAILHDVRTHADVWNTTLTSQGQADAFHAAPEVFVDKQSIWLCTGDQVTQLDRATGTVKTTVPIVGLFGSFTPAGSSILVVSTISDTRRMAMEIDCATGETSRRTVDVPRSEKHNMPDELPPNVAPTAGVLLSQALDEQKFNKPLDAVSSEFFSAGQNLVELRVMLVKPNVNWVKSIKPRSGPSLLNGNTTASTAGVEQEVLNDIKRSQTGGVKPIDESTYQVRLRRWLADQPVEWKGEVTGVPSFFSMTTVDLVTAGKSLMVFDKKNGKLFDATLSYSVGERFSGMDGMGLSPAVERDGVLYFFDQGVLTAFSLPGGQVQWRLTSVGISQIQFDGGGNLYIDTTTAAPESIQYSDEITFQNAAPVILKVDPHAGKILWEARGVGQHCVPVGKYVYTVSKDQGGIGLANGLANALGQHRPDAPVYLHIFRLDPDTGKPLWKFYREEGSEEEVFQDNWFAVRFGNDVQIFKYLVL
jgi:cytoskeletal protein RodZ